jgi:hypothetical protein
MPYRIIPRMMSSSTPQLRTMCRCRLYLVVIWQLGGTPWIQLRALAKHLDNHLKPHPHNPSFGKAPRQSPETPSSQPNMSGFNEVENLADHIRSAESSKPCEAFKNVPTNLGKRKHVSEEYRDLMVGFTGAVNNVAESLKQPVKEDCSLYGDIHVVVMGVPGFTDEALMCALSYILDNKSQGYTFLLMTEEHKVLWLRTFLRKHYYI